MKFININHEKKKKDNNILTLSEESDSLVKENLKKSEIQNKAKENKLNQLKEINKNKNENDNKNSNKENNTELKETKIENRRNSRKVSNKTEENGLIDLDNSDIVIKSKRRENNLEQIEKLTRDLLGYQNDKKTKTLNPISNIENKENKEENSFNDVMTEDEKKKRRKFINVYDFII